MIILGPKLGRTLDIKRIHKRSPVRKTRDPVIAPNLKAEDLIVLNDPSSLGAERMKATIYRGEKVEKAFTDATKRQVADWLVRAL